MTYADRAARFLATHRTPTLPRAPNEINERNEKRGEELAVVVHGAALPRDCIGPRVCTVVGPCERRDAGRPCLIVVNGDSHD